MVEVYSGTDKHLETNDLDEKRQEVKAEVKQGFCWELLHAAAPAGEKGPLSRHLHGALP